MAKGWWARYRAYERRCVRVDKLPEGKKREAAFKRLSREYDRLWAERPIAPPSEASPRTAFEEARENLFVALIHSACNASDRSLLHIWLDQNCQCSPPPIDDEHLNNLIPKVVWARDHAKDATSAQRESDVGKNGGDTRGYSDPDNYSRNKWLFEQRQSGLTMSALPLALHAKCEETHWYPLDSESGIRDAIRSYAAFHGLPFPQGRRGRPRKMAKP